MDKLFCLPGLLQGAGEAAVGKKLTWCSHRCPLPLHTSSPHDKLGISASSLSPAGFLSTYFISRLFEGRERRTFCYYRVVTQCFILLVSLSLNEFCSSFRPLFLELGRELKAFCIFPTTSLCSGMLLTWDSQPRKALH